MPVQRLIAILLALAALLLPRLAGAATYVGVPATYSWVSSSGHTVATWGGGCTGQSAPNDDDITTELPIGFTFNFGGVNYTTVRIMTNGRLQFNNPYCETYAGPAIPSANLVRTLRIYGEDLDPGTGGTVTYKSIGTSPNRKFVVTWNNVIEYGRPGSYFNLQVILQENGDFIYQWGSAAGYASGSAQVGYQLTTTDYIVHGTSAIASLSGTALRWTKPVSVLSGTVFEDVNYGGGAGRNLSAASGTAVNGATVELYNASGSFVSSTTTNASGAYSFTVTTAGTWHVRVASGTVRSTRSGGSSAVGVMTYRTTATGGSAVAQTDHVGGVAPARIDPGPASSGATFNTSTYVYSAGLTGTAHAVAPVTPTLGINVSGLDFGFNFDTVTNTNDSGQGSLRQAIVNANALGGDSSLAQAGRTAGLETVIFMISNGTANAGLRSSQNLTSGGVATINVASALPAVSSPLSIDGTFQPGFSTSTYAPRIEINGAATAAGITGLVLSADKCVVKGLVINRFGGNGITLSSGTSAHLISGNYIGTNSAGTAASPNSGHGVDVRGSNSTVGGTAAGAGNLLSGNTGSGIWFAGGSGNAVQGNRIGTAAGGTTGVANGGAGVAITVSNVSSNTIGGTAAGAGNIIAFNGQQGVVVSGASSGDNAISRNSIFSNTGIGIDIAGAGRTANNGTRSTSLGNAEIDTPVFTSARLSGTTLTVTGYVGSAAGQTPFGSSRVEIFKALNDGTGYGQGQVYLGMITADSSGNFSGTLTVSGLAEGDSLTATAADAGGDTSEFAANATVTGLTIGGIVFEDVNYGGGAGRNRTTALAAGAVVRPNVRVELYLASGSTATFVGATTTDAAGAYQFTGLTDGSYRVRVQSSSVGSSRSGATSALRPVATFFTDAGSGTALDVTDQVGGGSPADTARATVPGTNGDTVSLSLATSEAVSPVTVAGGAITGVDFGFNFNTVTNTNDSGAGSLRQVIINANTLGGEGALAQAGRTPGLEHVVFMISNGSSSAGLRATVNLFTTRTGSHAVAALAPASPLPTISAALTLDAQTQPGWSGLPVIDIDGAGAGSGTSVSGLTITGAQTTVRGFVLRRFAQSGVSISASNVTVQGNHLGTNAAGTVAEGNGHSGVISAASGTVVGGNTASQRNLISGNGVGVHLSAAGAVVTGNYVGTTVDGTGKLANTAFGVGVMANVAARIGGTTAAERNVIGGNGTDGIYALGTPTIQGNLIGLGADGSSNIGNARNGVWANCSAGGAVGGTASGAGNVIANNGGSGVLVSATCRTLPIRGNSIHGNTRPGIDLGETTAGSGVGNGATANDGAKSADQANQYMDAPVFTSASLAGTTLTVAGYVGSAAGQAVFASSPVEVFVADASGAAPSGRTFLGNVTTDASGNFNGTITLSGGTTLAAGVTALVGTATDGSGNTSEFGPALTYGRTVSGTVYEDLNYGGGAGRSRATAGGVGVANATVELIGSDGLLKASTTTATDGSYRFGGAGEGHYVVRVVQASVRSTRSGSSSAAVGVQTWRHEASWTSPGPVTDEVGGLDPAAADGAAGVASYGWTDCAAENATCIFSGTRLVRYGADSTWTTRVLTGGTACTNVVFGDPLVGVSKACQVLNAQLHSVSSASTRAGDVANVDFGFNFNTVVNTNASGAGSLQQVVTNANTLGGDTLLAQAGRSAGVEHVVFMIPNGSTAAGNAASGGKLLLTGGLRAGLNAFSGGVATLTPGSRLLVSQSLVIDAQTQPGWTANPVVELVGTGAPSTHSGVELTAGTSTVRGLVVNRWPQSGINAYGGSGHVVQGNWLGTDRTGTAAAANAQQGLNVYDVGSMQIGGTTAADRNVLSGNGNVGLVVVANGSGVVVQGNFVGTNAAGTAAVGNASLGVYLGSAGVTVGGMASGAGNVISGNTYGGLVIDGTATGVTVRGNRIGTNAGGTAAVPNQTGITVLGAANTVIGGSDPAARNLVSGNSSFGIDLQGSATGMVVQGNHVGPDVTGNARIGNGATGIVVRSPGVAIGGVGAGNVISGNGSGQAAAVDVLATATGTVIQGNTIGLGADGNTALANPWDGLQVRATGVQVGGTATGAGNVISAFNAGASGIAVFAGANNVVIEGNTIGLNAARSVTRPNGHGVWFQAGTTGGRVGGSSASAANVIAGNALTGVAVIGSTSAVRVQRNSIWGNTGLGIDLSASSATGDGVTANNGTQASGEPNRGMDFPALTTARARGNQLTVTGYVGLPPGTALFAGATVDLYTGDGSARPSGQTWLGSLSVASDGTFSGTLTMPVASLAMGTVLTGTATDGSGNTSEFGPGFTALVVDFVVNTTADEADLTPGDGQCLTAAGLCSLRAAITELNALTTLSATPTVAFALPGCSAAGQAACSIAPTTVLPTVARAMAIDASTQPGFDAGTATPLVQLSGATAPANAIGLVVNTGGFTLRGLVVNRWGSHGLSLGGSGNTVAGNWFGVNAAGTGTAANGGNGIEVTGSNHQIGGGTLADRNVASGNSGAGIALKGSGNTVTGNIAGLLPDGSTAAGNGGDGIYVSAAGQTIGGGSGKGNLASANKSSGVRLDVGADNSVIQGNCIGVAADCSTPRGNGFSVSPASGVGILGGTGSRISGNVIAYSANAGVGFGAVVQKVSILGNSIFANTGEGIRLNIADANDGAYNSAQSNRGIDNPVITGAGIDTTGTAMTVFGYIGTGTGQAAFAGARVELYRAAPDLSGYGEGKVYLGALTADGDGRFSGTISLTAGQAAVGDVITATTTDSSGNTSEFGPNWVTTTLEALSPAGFNAFETDTPLAAITGVIRSKVGGTPVQLAVVALDTSGLKLHPGFTGTVSLTWLDARDDSGPTSGSCRSSWKTLGAAGSVSFSANARATATLTPPASGTRVMRLKISYTNGAIAVDACSSDAFAVLPASLALAATDGSAASAGTTRTLNTTAASGGAVHQAGRPFTVTARALDAAGAAMTGYTGTPQLAVAGCLLPAGCSAGTLSAPSVAAVAGVYSNALVSYAEVGAISLQLTDADYAAVDSADTSAAQRTLQPALLPVGRFVPDSLEVTVSGVGRLATANGACLASGQGATFIGQGFGWDSAPQVTVTARNAAGGVATLWTGALMKLTAAAQLPGLAVASAGSATSSASFGPVAVTDLGGGRARVDASATDRFVLDLPAGSVQPSVTPVWTWTLAVNDASEAAVAGNPVLGATAKQAGVPFDRGAPFHSGRLALSAGHGDARAGVRSLLQLQRFTSAGWVTMTEDRGCVTVQPQHLGVELPAGVFEVAGRCAAPLAGAATTQGGRAWLALPGTPGAAPGRLALRVAGSAASGNSCSPAGALADLKPLGMPWLLGGASGAGPLALLTWGLPNRDVVLRRETW